MFTVQTVVESLFVKVGRRVVSLGSAEILNESAIAGITITGSNIERAAEREWLLGSGFFSGALFGVFTGGLTIVFILSSVSVTAYLPESIIRCSTTGPSANAGT